MSRLYEGIRVDHKDNIIFNWDYDDSKKDCLYLDGFRANYFNEDGIRYVYAYQYSPNASERDKKIIRTYLKSKQGFKDKNVRDLVDNGVLKLDSVNRINSFDALLTIKSSKPFSLTNLIHIYLTEYSITPYIDFELVKKSYDGITIDYNKIQQALKKLRWDKIRIENFIDELKEDFDYYKQRGFLFEMKRILPRQIREAFSNFLQFRTEENRQIYEKLQNANVLIYNDFLISGSTVKEVIGYLKAINPNCNIVLYGFSMGGATVCMAAGENLPSNVSGIIEDSGYTSVSDIKLHIDSSSAVSTDFKNMFNNSLKLMQEQYSNYNELINVSFIDQVSKCKIPILFLHGSEDTLVPAQHAQNLYNAATSASIRNIYISQGCGHVEGISEDAAYAQGIVDVLNTLKK